MFCDMTDEGQRETARSRQSSESSSREAAGLQSPSGDSFKAFTGTVDALALQNSVIGKLKYTVHSMMSIV